MEKILNLLEKKYNGGKCIYIVVCGFLIFYTLIFIHTKTLQPYSPPIFQIYKHSSLAFTGGPAFFK